MRQFFPAIARFSALLAFTGFAAVAQTYTASTFAGGALPVNIQGPSASLYGPQSAIAIGPAGNVFFADGNTILRLDAASGLITLVAGNGTAGYSGDNGPAVSAQIRGPYGLAADAAGNLYISSIADNVVREVSGGVITTIAGTGVPGFSGDNGPAAAAELNAPYGVAVDGAGNLYIADYANNRIRKISGGIITTIAGDGNASFGGDNGPATLAQLKAPFGVAVDSSGNVFVSDRGNNRIRMIASGTISTVAGNGTPGYSGDNGPGTAAQLNVPCGIALDPAGNLLIADYYNNRVRKLSNGAITTVAGTGVAGFGGDNGLAAQALLNQPFTVAADASGNVYIGDYGNQRIRRISNQIITTAAGNGTAGFSGDGGAASSAQLRSPYSIAISAAGDVFTADYQNSLIRGIAAGVINTIAGTGTAGFSGDNGSPAGAQFNEPAAVTFDSSGNIYIADFGNNRVRKISAGIITTVAGNGTSGFGGDGGAATSAQLNQPTGVAVDSAGRIYIADSANNRIRKITGTTITTIAGTGAAGFSGDGAAAASAQLSNPTGLTVDSAGSLYIADSGNNRIRKITNGVITTVAGTGVAGYSGDNGPATSAQLYGPGAIAVISGTVYIADTMNNAIRQVSAGVITTIAGGDGTLAGPRGIALDAAGKIYIADTLNNRIRLLTQLPLSIVGPLSSLPDGTMLTAYTPTVFSATGGVGSYTWSATGLPKGMSFSGGGVLAGTPTVAGSATVQFTVKDSTQATASVSLSININPPVPLLSSLSPTAVTSSGATFTLTVTGTGFISGAVIEWNGTPLTTKVVSATQLTASVAASLIATPGSADITVTSAGVTTDPLTIPINAPTPTLTALSPKNVTATTGSFTLTATGKGYVQASQVMWNDTPLETDYVSSTQLTAVVTADLIANAGSANITVSSGGNPSSKVIFTINAPPAISALAPQSVTAYGPAFTLTVTGSGFAPGASVTWDGTPLVTKLLSATKLTVTVPAGTIGGTGSVSIVVSCSGASSDSFPLPIDPPPPVITTLQPAAAVATSAAFTLTVNGTGFSQGASVQWNGAALPTTYVSPTQLNAYVADSLIASAGNVTVLVSSGGVSSATAPFTITAPPTVTSTTPSQAIAGGPGFTMTVTGTGFVSGTQVQWNGASLATTFVSATKLTAAVPASLIAFVSSVTVSVISSGASSNGAVFGINGPPAITSLSPGSATAGGPAFTLTVNGSGFTGATVTWNGTAITTKVVSDTQMTAAVSTTLIAAAGTANVGAMLGGIASLPVAFTIDAPPAISALTPGSVPGDGTPFTLTITGTGFQDGATIQWNGTPLDTTFVSATQLTAAVPANLAASAGTATITAVNPSGAASASAKLSISAAAPSINLDGVVPLYSSVPVVQPGSWISIYGTGLGKGVFTWTGNYPTTLGGTTVRINNKLAYLWLVSPTQINLQAPNDTTTGPVNVVVTTASGSTTTTVTLAPYGPSLSLLPGSNYAASVILTPDGSGAYGGGTYDLAGPAGAFSFATRPVRAGELLELYGVGFGPTATAVAAGKTYNGATPTTGPVTVTIGGAPAQVLFSGLTASGVFQINLIVPNTASGDQPVMASVGGSQIPTGVLLSVQ